VLRLLLRLGRRGQEGGRGRPCPSHRRGRSRGGGGSVPERKVLANERVLAAGVGHELVLRTTKGGREGGGEERGRDKRRGTERRRRGLTVSFPPLASAAMSAYACSRNGVGRNGSLSGRTSG
jgi:hypothetical protein